MGSILSKNSKKSMRLEIDWKFVSIFMETYKFDIVIIPYVCLTTFPNMKLYDLDGGYEVWGCRTIQNVPKDEMVNLVLQSGKSIIYDAIDDVFLVSFGSLNSKISWNDIPFKIRSTSTRNLTFQ